MAHTFDLATHVPGDLAVMWDLAWYGIPARDPLPGPDPEVAAEGYGNWWLAGAEYKANLPASYPEAYYNVVEPQQCGAYYGGAERRIASYFRPAMGPYSSSGQDDLGLAKLDLDLGLLRRAGDPRGRCTAWAVETAALGQTTVGGAAPGDAQWLATSDIRVKRLQQAIVRAEADAGLGPCITFAYNAQFVVSSGLYQEASDQLGAIRDDLTWYVDAIKASTKALRVKNGAYDPTGRLLIFLWIGAGNDYSAQDWNAFLEEARTNTGEDFYVASRYAGFSGGFSVFNFADACWPWVGPSDWDSSTGATMRDRAEDWTRLRHDQVITEAASFTGRVVMGSLFPGFEDWARGFGQGLDRDIPRAEELVQGQVDRFLTDGITALQVGTWNDWPEGSQWEPRRVTSGSLTTKDGADPPSDISAEGDELRWLTEQVARLYSETVTAAETDALVALWAAYGAPRGCAALGPYSPRSSAADAAATGGAASAATTGGPAGQAQASGPGGASQAGGPADAKPLTP